MKIPMFFKAVQFLEVDSNGLYEGNGSYSGGLGLLQSGEAESFLSAPLIL